MSLIKANAVQVGQSNTATQNFTLAVPSSPDGTIKLARGNSGATTQDVLSVSNAGVVSFPQGLGNISSGTAIATGSTTARSLANRFADVLNVKDFGAIGNGVTDDTAAIQAAINFAISAGGTQVYFDTGNYLVSSTITINGSVSLYGIFERSRIRANFSNGDVLVVNGATSEVDFSGLLIESNVGKRTGGYYINFVSANTSRIYNCQFSNGYMGVGYTGEQTAWHKIYNSRFISNKHMGINISGWSAASSSGNVDVVISDCYIAGEIADNTYHGIYISAIGDISLRHVSTGFCNNGLTISPITGRRAQAVFLTDCLFDLGQGYGIYCYTALGAIHLLSISQTWVATNFGGGIYLGGSGSVSQVNLSDVYCSNNNGNGLTIDSNCENITINGGSFASNVNNGIFVAANVTNFMIRGAICGPTGEFVANNGYGIYIASGTSNNYIVSNNQLAGNTAGSFFDGGTGTNKITYPNLGVGTAITTNSVQSVDWGIDFAKQGSVSVVNGTPYQLGVGSGLVLLHNNTTGDLAMFLCYGGAVTKVSGAASMVSGAAGASQIGLAYNGTKYQISNGYVAAQQIIISTIKTRLAS